MPNRIKELGKETKPKLDFANDKYLTNWLTNRPKHTQRVYKTAMKRYAEYTSMTPKEMLKEKEEDMKLPPMKQGKVERRIKGFFEWLKTECPNTRTGEKGIAGMTARNYVGDIADFYSRHNMPLHLKWREDFKAVPKPVNMTEKMTASLVEKLAYYAPELRDKAIVWCMFQSGMDISTVLSLNCGHIAKEIEDVPMGAILLKNLVREKGEVPHHSLFYKTAIKHLKMYLEERFGKDWIKEVKSSKNYEEPLFLGRSRARHHRQYFQALLREIAPLTFIANSRFEHADINPLRPHSLRASFNDQMAKAGAVKELRDFLMGHEVAFDCAYFGGEEGLRKTYVQYAQEVLEPKGIPPDVEMALEKQKTTVESLVAMYSEEKKQRVELEKALEEMRKKVKKYEALEPLASAVEARGGLPEPVVQRLIDRWMIEGEIEMETGKPIVEVDLERILGKKRKARKS